MPYKEDEGGLSCKENIRRKSGCVKRKTENGVGVDEILKKRKTRSLKDKKLCLKVCRPGRRKDSLQGKKDKELI